MKNIDMQMHVRGKSVFVDDIITPESCLYCALITSPIAKGILKKADYTEVLKYPGVVKVITANDIPGKNQIGHMAPDQPMFAEKNLEYIGQPIALVVAKTRKIAERARKLVKLEYDELEPVLDPKIAFSQGLVHSPRRIMTVGNTTEAFKNCAVICEGTITSGPQEHFYFETQRALAIPIEDNKIKVCASSQAPGAFHHHIAEILGIPMNKVEFDIRRLGGGFGGKESTAVWVVAPALAAKLLNRPVKLILDRNEDIATSGKRHGYVYDYKIGLDAEGNILSYEIDLYQHAGACADISLAVLGRSFLHTCGAYRIPNFKATAVSCKTNIPPNNAFRGFGVPQGTFAIEFALTQAAEKLGVDPIKLKKQNLLKDGDKLPYGVTLEKVNLLRCWDTLDKQVNLSDRRKKVEDFNKKNKYFKRGIAVTPVCFGISFAQTALNQAGALVNIYIDGSIVVSTGAVEMGQGVNAKIAAIAANTLGVNTARVHIETTNTLRVPNASPTSASTGADLNGMATQKACLQLLERLRKFAAKKMNCQDINDIQIKDDFVYLKNVKTDYRWETLVFDAYWDRIDLSAHDFYATPDLHFNRDTETGKPFAYYAFGASLIEVEIDCIKSTFDIISINIIHDVGKSISPEIDRGQIEGAVIQGIGWATIEQIKYAKNGRMLTAVNSYKIPDIKFIPKNFNVTLLENSENPFAVCNSKAVGEPPFIHGIGAYFALIDALRAIRKDKPLPSLPITPEKIMEYIN